MKSALGTEKIVFGTPYQHIFGIFISASESDLNNEPVIAPVRVFVCLSTNSRYSSPSTSRHSFTSPHLINSERLTTSENNCGNQILKAFANSLDPDETPQNVAFSEGKNWLLDWRMRAGWLAGGLAGWLAGWRNKLTGSDDVVNAKHNGGNNVIVKADLKNAPTAGIEHVASRSTFGMCMRVREREREREREGEGEGEREEKREIETSRRERERERGRDDARERGEFADDEIDRRDIETMYNIMICSNEDEVSKKR
ncbi:hypothetical protein DPMN_156054 [Dreissena polymorpha]|uniref:Uncharacterized protein n=1 Tax=Dreissena polymorpha TaxID=45954 RepID=A0A9D4FSF4_DREPO|nr:hypothetical protein DPMN_156054 [Dreissena polymorpha]